ncbi:unnamed protein product [Dovyalis caffra]|uniref:Uncharacterized protein n=1 Tax=Dovyalis caffra TaxID=77055 RepID=A0AAV1RY05_9ROSI|nr:unnamed protein product [Dovyalis caffra]
MNDLIKMRIIDRPVDSEFWIVIVKTWERYLHRNNQLKLSIVLLNLKLSSLLDKWERLALESGVKGIDLSVVALGVKEELHLTDIHIDEHVFSELVYSCPSMENLSEICDGQAWQYYWKGSRFVS